MTHRRSSTTQRWFRWFWIGVLIAIVLAVSACSETVYVNEPQPEVPAGFFALSIEHVVPPRFSSLAADGDVGAGIRGAASALPIGGEHVRLEATGNGGMLATAGRVYVHVEFVLHNDGDSPLENLVLLAYNHEAFRAESAISQALLQGARVAPDRMVRLIRPTHRLAFDATRSGTPEALIGRPNASDFVALRESELPTLDDAAFVRTLFPYGFRVGGGAPIAPGESATVYVAFSVLAIPASMRARPALERFTWNAVLLSLPGLGVTQAAEENHARGWSAVLDRAIAADAETVVAIGAGPRQIVDVSWCDRVVGLPNVRIAGMGPTDPAYAGLAPVPGPPQFVGCEGVSP
jgi:hypothetical protein